MNEELSKLYFSCRKVHSNIFKIDCTQKPLKSEKSFYVCETSFIMADWIFMDFLTSSDKVNYDSLPKD